MPRKGTSRSKRPLPRREPFVSYLFPCVCRRVLWFAFFCALLVEGASAAVSKPVASPARTSGLRRELSESETNECPPGTYSSSGLQPCLQVWCACYLPDDPLSPLLPFRLHPVTTQWDTGRQACPHVLLAITSLCGDRCNSFSAFEHMPVPGPTFSFTLLVYFVVHLYVLSAVLLPEMCSRFDGGPLR